MKRLQYLTDHFGHKASVRFLSYESPMQREIAQNVVNKLSELDPSKNKKFTQWLLREYVNGAFRLDSVDKQKVLLYLKTFESYKAVLSCNDILKFSWKGLIELISPYLEEGSVKAISKRDLKAAYRQMLFDTHQVDTFYVNDLTKTRVLRLNTEAASKYYGKGTRWCVSSNDNNEFEHYHELGNLYFIQYKNKKFLLQLRYEDDSVTFLLANSNDDYLHLDKEHLGSFPFTKYDFEFAQVLELLLIWESLVRGVSINFSEKTLLDCMQDNQIVYSGPVFTYKTPRFDNRSKVASSKAMLDRNDSFVRLMKELHQMYCTTIKYCSYQRLRFTPPAIEMKELLNNIPYLEFVFNLTEEYLTSVDKEAELDGVWNVNREISMRDYFLGFGY